MLHQPRFLLQIYQILLYFLRPRHDSSFLLLDSGSASDPSGGKQIEKANILLKKLWHFSTHSNKGQKNRGNSSIYFTTTEAKPQLSHTPTTAAKYYKAIRSIDKVAEGYSLIHGHKKYQLTIPRNKPRSYVLHILMQILYLLTIYAYFCSTFNSSLILVHHINTDGLAKRFHY